MKLGFSPQEREIRQRAHDLAAALRPFEDWVDEAGGSVSAALEHEIRSICLASGLFAPNMPREVGGAELTLVEQIVVEEELGELTGCLWSALWRPPNVLVHATESQRERYVAPYARGEFRGCYAVTEQSAGSDAARLSTTARTDGDGWLINGEKWFATGADVARFILVVANAGIADEPAPTIFFVERDAPGLTIGRQPRFTHNGIYGHPELMLRDVRVGPAAVLGSVGGGMTLTYDWFREERLMIAARCLGAARRCIELAEGFARERVAFGTAIGEQQAVQWMLADSVTELAAARALLYQIVSSVEAGLDPKLAHGQAAMVKLFASEMVGRVTDRCVQIFGGRGYMRENPVERLWRDTRLDRIWEGTSEMQRLIIARALAKRGLDSLVEL